MKNDFKSNVNKAKGFGGAKEGSKTWLVQRMSAVALIPMVIWFVLLVLRMSFDKNIDFAIIIKSPINAVVMLLFIIFGLHHGTIGMKEIVEDYVHYKKGKIFCILSLCFVKYITIVAGILSIVKMHLLGS
jgi:succinate dehydrogenase / fumarate reductase, membrane anchor subunit